MRKIHHFLLITSLLLSGWMFSPLPLAQAGQLYSVSLNTSPLIGNPAGPFYVEFQLNDGSGTGDGNNTVELSNFQFGGSSAVGNPTTLTGGTTGSLTTGVVITDSSFFNEFIQQFSPGGILSFDLYLIPNLDSGPTPDQFSFAILDNQHLELPTESFSIAFLTIDFTSPLSVQTFSSTSGSVSVSHSADSKCYSRTRNAGAVAGGVERIAEVWETTFSLRYYSKRVERISVAISAA